MEPEPSEARCPLDFRSYRKSCRKISHNVVIKNLRLLGRRHGTDVERSQHGTKGTKRKAGQPAFFVLVSQQENIMKKYSVYIRCSYEPLDSASPTHREVHSMEVSTELLPFVAALKDAHLAEPCWEIETILILPEGALCQLPIDEHHDSIDEFLNHFGGVRFKKKIG